MLPLDAVNLVSQGRRDAERMGKEERAIGRKRD